MATVTPLCCGSLRFDKSVLVAGATGIEIEAPSTVYLIEAEEVVLVDTSFGDVDRMADLHPDFECRRPPERTLSAALDRRGYTPEDVDAVVCSHLDWDHCYNLDRFVEGGAEIYVQRTELEYAIAPYPMHAVRYEAKSLGREPPWLHVPLTPLDGETEICAGVVAFPTPGHTVGHQSVAVETSEGTVVAAADAIPTFENLRGSADAPLIRGLAMNDFEWWRSAQEVAERADEVLPGHEWAILNADPIDG
jgi:glyoxylase-like metal-dependent hydrolase (beta-lactamase superfamily II)